MRASALGGDALRQANVVTSSTTIFVCEKGQRWQCALRRLAEIDSAGDVANVVTNNATIFACELGQQGQCAPWLLGEMPPAGAAADVQAAWRPCRTRAPMPTR